jgi:hypothetical protein
LSENASNLAEYVEYQSQQAESMTVSDFGDADNWTFADLNTISRLVTDNTLIVKEIVEKIPKADESILEMEKSLKKRKYPEDVLIYSRSKEDRDRALHRSN